MWRIQDFPDQEGESLPIVLPNFPQKLHENDKNWTERGRAFLDSRPAVLLILLMDPNSFLKTTKQWIKGSLVNFICEAKSVSKQDALILITWSSKVMQWTESTLSKLAIFPCIHWVE